MVDEKVQERNTFSVSLGSDVQARLDRLSAHMRLNRSRTIEGLLDFYLHVASLLSSRDSDVSAERSRLFDDVMSEEDAAEVNRLASDFETAENLRCFSKLRSLFECGLQGPFEAVSVLRAVASDLSRVDPVVLSLMDEESQIQSEASEAERLRKAAIDARAKKFAANAAICAKPGTPAQKVAESAVKAALKAKPKSKASKKGGE